VRAVRGANLLDKVAPPLPLVSHGPGTRDQGKGFAKTMNTVLYALIYIVAAVLLVTGVFLVVPALMP
jgi:hypothetical protein